MDDVVITGLQISSQHSTRLVLLTKQGHSDPLVEGSENSVVVFAATVLLNGTSLGSFRLVHHVADELLVVHVELGVQKRDGAHQIDVIDAGFLKDLDVSDILPQVWGEAKLVRERVEESVKFTQVVILSGCFIVAERQAGGLGDSGFLLALPDIALISRGDVGFDDGHLADGVRDLKFMQKKSGMHTSRCRREECRRRSKCP